jgi:hypothetical protein
MVQVFGIVIHNVLILVFNGILVRNIKVTSWCKLPGKKQIDVK